MIRNASNLSNLSSLLVVKRHTNAFVDDTQNCVNNAGLPTPWLLEELLIRLEALSQNWDKLLYSSGGALELSPFFIYWQWRNGNLVMLRKKDMTVRQIRLTSGSSLSPIVISHTDVHEPHTTLGVCLARLLGDMSAHYHKLLEKSIKLATHVFTSNLTRSEAYLAYRASWVPAMLYSLGPSMLHPW